MRSYVHGWYPSPLMLRTATTARLPCGWVDARRRGHLWAGRPRCRLRGGAHQGIFDRIALFLQHRVATCGGHTTTPGREGHPERGLAGTRCLRCLHRVVGGVGRRRQREGVVLHHGFALRQVSVAPRGRPRPRGHREASRPGGRARGTSLIRLLVGAPPSGEASSHSLASPWRGAPRRYSWSRATPR